MRGSGQSSKIAAFVLAQVLGARGLGAQSVQDSFDRPSTELADRYNRAHWVVIDEIGHIEGDEDRGELASMTFDGASGLVDAVREGNTVTVRAYHTPRFTLLISPEEFDLTQPIRVVTNGEVSFEGLVEPDVATLQKWAAIDHDRTMLFAAEIPVVLGSP